MPTLGAYVTDEIASAINAAAEETTGGKIAPWLGEAARQRLEREGRLPGTDRAKAIAEMVDLVDALGPEEFRRRMMAAASAAA